MTPTGARRAVPAAVVLAVAAVLALPAVVPLILHNRCGEMVLRSAFRDKSHYHHVADPDPVKAARSIRVRGCITRARNRIFLSVIELTPLLAAAVWFLFIRSRDG